MEAQTKKRWRDKGRLAFLLAVALFLSLNLVSAYDNVTTDTKPVITFNYGEKVLVTFAELKDLTEVVWELESRPDIGVQYSSQYEFEPVSHLPNQEYVLTITAEDLIGNARTTEYHFLENASYMDFWVKAPAPDFASFPDIGVSVSSPFNATIESEEAATCEWGFSPSAYPYQFDDIVGNNYLLEAVNGLGGTAGSEISVKKDDNAGNNNILTSIYLFCEEISQRPHFGTVQLGWDDTPPSIDVEAVPNPVVDFIDPTTKLSIKSNDPSYCTYNLTPFPSMNKAQLDTYVAEMENTIDYTEVTLLPLEERFSPHAYVYDITCVNWAGLEYSTSYTVTVDLAKEFAITLIEPEGYTNTEPVVFSIETQVTTDECRYGETEPTTPFVKTGPRSYTTSLALLEEGTHSYLVECSGSIGTQSSTLSFVVDRTPPTKPVLKPVDPTCSLEELQVEAISTDEVSGVAYYNYSVKNGTKIVVDWTTTTGEQITESVSMSEGEKYSWHVKAVDNAGNMGLESTVTVMATAQNASDCDTTPPIGGITSNATETSIAVSVTCRDVGTGCSDIYNYNFVPNGSCNASMLGKYAEQPLTFLTEGTFCWTVYDRNENTHSGSASLSLVPKNESSLPEECLNGVMDGNETDIDCGGGECEGCEVDETCILDDDCKSKMCPEGICTEAACNDGLLNGDESDIDCGGSECEPCDNGMNCTEHPDCFSEFCSPETETCDDSSCTDGFKGGDETDIDCGGSCPACGEGNKCIENSDCDTGNCAMGVCDVDRDADSDGDGMPDYWEEENSFDPNDPSDALEDADDDGFTNLDEYYEGTDPWDPEDHPYVEKSSLLALILLILGILLFVGGIGFLVADKYMGLTASKTKPMPAPRLLSGERGKPPVLQARPQQKPSKEQEIRQALARLRQAKKQEKRKTLLSTFGKEEEGKAATVKKVLGGKAAAGKKGETAKTKEKPLKKLDEGKTEEFIQLGDKFEKEDVGKDVFQELEEMTKEKEPAKKGKTPEKKTEKKEPPKKKETKSVGKKKVIKKKKAVKKLPSSAIDKDVFNQLQVETGHSTKKLESVVKKKEVNTKDMLKIFAQTTSKKQIDANVFETLLSELMKRGKVNKLEISDMVLEFYEQDLLTKKDVHSILTRLKLI